MEKEKLGENVAITGVGSAPANGGKTCETGFERVSEQLGCKGGTVSTENSVAQNENIVSESQNAESAELAEASKNAAEEPKSQLENYIDNLDKDFTDDENSDSDDEFDDDETDDESESADSEEEEDDGEISFADLGLDEEVLAAIEKKGFKHPSPIQVLAIPRLLNGDSNIIAKARTGTGKTANRSARSRRKRPCSCAYS